MTPWTPVLPVPVVADERDDVRANLRLSPSLAALALFLVLAVFHTWPLASAPNSLSRHDNADAVLNEWAIAWVAHQLPRNPWHLFDANIFYPEPNTLAFSEHLFVQSLMGAPLLWLGAPTLLVNNLLILAGFTLTGWTMCLMMWRRTADWPAAVLAGMLLAFNAHTLARIAHLQALHIEFLPLAIFSLDRLLARPGFANALKLALMYVLQSLTSNYLLVLVTFGMAAAAVVRAPEWVGRHRARVFGLLCASAVMAAALLFPFLIHYYDAQRNQGLTRSLDEVAKYAASWQDYLAASGRLHYESWSARFWRGTGAPLFPGITALVCAGVTIATGTAWRRRSARMWFAMGIVGFILSFGAAIPGYPVLYHAFPLLQGIRASVRFGYLVLAAVAALAGFGLALLRTRYSNRPQLALAIGVVALLMATVEVARIPVAYEPAHRTPGVYRLFAGESQAVIVELPLYSGPAFFRNSHYMLHATVHGKPILNGYSGFVPASYARHAAALRPFPDASAIAYLRQVGVTHVVVHENAFNEVREAERFKRIERTPELRVFVRAGNITVYRLEPESR